MWLAIFPTLSRPAEPKLATLVAVHSFRGGTGKSNTTANLAVALASRGRRVGIVDLDLPSPGVHVLFGAKMAGVDLTLNSYLQGECRIQDAAYDVGGELSLGDGLLLLVPASIEVTDIARIVKDGYDVQRLTRGIIELSHARELDFVLIDTHPGLHEETLLGLSIADVALIVLRPDEQDLQGTAVTVRVARELGVPKLLLVVNNLLESFDSAQVRAEMEATYGVPVVAVLPNSEDLIRNASSDVFIARFPEHRWSREIVKVADSLVEMHAQAV
jgi:MinD-like ATPase involved in chromosome partitioning or flagellar assembly